MRYHQKIVNRIKRTEGQMRGIQKMMEEDKGCKEVITQLSAIRSAIDKTIALIVAENLHHCVVESVQSGRDSSKEIEEAIKLLTNSK